MKITIFGSGYVGLVAATCFAEVGNRVTCVDVDSNRVARLSDGECLIYEPGLVPLLSNNLNSERLRFVHDFRLAQDADVYFIAVGTPSTDDGAADLGYVEQVALVVGLLLIRKAL